MAWPGPLKKSGSPNVMCSAPGDLAADVFQHYFLLHDAECAAIDGDHGAMAAEMLAAA